MLQKDLFSLKFCSACRKLKFSVSSLVAVGPAFLEPQIAVRWNFTQPAKVWVFRSQLIEIGWHLVDLSIVMVLDLFEESSIFGEDKVDRSSLSAESASAANSVNVVLLLHRKLVVDDKTNLLHIDTSSEQVCRDQDSYGSRSELLHYDFTFLLVHLSVHAGDHEVLSRH